MKKGGSHTLEARAKISAARKGTKASLQTRAKMSAAMKGLKHSPFTAEHRAKLSTAHKGLKISLEHRAKISAALLGRKRGPLSPEHRRKLSIAHRGIKFGPERCANMARWEKKNGNWNGGWAYRGPGYISVLRHDHPFSDGKGYVLEHRLLMESRLGRLLSPTEVVHHINGNIKDNRIENLMLFSSSGKHLKYHNAERGKE